MVWFILLAIIILCFCGVIIFGAPYLPTLKPQIEESLDLVDLKPGQTLLELGCGDGRVVIAAANRGIKVIGYELNPFLALLCWLRTRRYKGNVKIVWGDFWKKQWPPADGVFVFLLDRYMSKLDSKLSNHQDKPLKLVSFAFKIPNKLPIKETKGLFLYSYH